MVPTFWDESKRNRTRTSAIRTLRKSCDSIFEYGCAFLNQINLREFTTEPPFGNNLSDMFVPPQIAHMTEYKSRQKECLWILPKPMVTMSHLDPLKMGGPGQLFFAPKLGVVRRGPAAPPPPTDLRLKWTATIPSRGVTRRVTQTSQGIYPTTIHQVDITRRRQQIMRKWCTCVRKGSIMQASYRALPGWFKKCIVRRVIWRIHIFFWITYTHFSLFFLPEQTSSLDSS